jgi:hypothetical protein
MNQNQPHTIVHAPGAFCNLSSHVSSLSIEWSADWIGGWRLGTADRFEPCHYQDLNGKPDLFVHSTDWFGMLRSASPWLDLLSAKSKSSAGAGDGQVGLVSRTKALELAAELFFIAHDDQELFCQRQQRLSVERVEKVISLLRD